MAGETKRIGTPLLVVGSAAVGILVGWLGGGVGPRRDLVERDERIAELTEQVASLDRGGWRSPVPGLDRILREPVEADGPLEGEANAEDQSDGARAPAADLTVDGGVTSDPDWRTRWRNRAARTPGEARLIAFERAASIQEVRRAQSRAALVEQAQLSAEETVELDRVVAALNAEIQGHAEELILLAMDDDPPPARDLLGVTHDVTGILARSQLALEALIGPDRLGAVEPSALEVWNFVDLTALEPAARAALAREP